MPRSRSRHLGDAAPELRELEEADAAEQQALVDQIKADLVETAALRADLAEITDEDANSQEAQDAALAAAEDAVAAARSLEAARAEIEADLARRRAAVAVAEARAR